MLDRTILCRVSLGLALPTVQLDLLRNRSSDRTLGHLNRSRSHEGLLLHHHGRRASSGTSGLSQLRSPPPTRSLLLPLLPKCLPGTTLLLQLPLRACIRGSYVAST